MDTLADTVEETSISRAAKWIVDLKFTLDTEAQFRPNYIPDDLHGPSTGGEYGPHFGSSFLSAILPFVANCDTDYDVLTEMEVPTSHVLGCSWRVWPDPNISSEDKDKVIAYINSNSGVDDTLYTYIPELMLFTAEEGKNRVNFCRFHNVEFIPARVLVSHYPSADRIKIYALNAVGGLDVWAVLDGRYVEKISHYSYALPMLRAYGVEIINSWPSKFPTISEILRDSKNRSQVDMDTIQKHLLEKKRKQAFYTELVNCNFFSLDIPLHRMLSIVAGLWFILFLSLFGWLDSAHDAVRIICAVLYGFSSGGLVIVFIPLLKCRRGLLRKQTSRNRQCETV